MGGRTLGDDFGDGGSSGALDLNDGKGHTPAAAPPMQYGGGGMTLDDDMFDDEGGAALELDMPARPAPAPDLPGPGAHPSGQMQAAHPSGQMQAARPSGQMQAARPSGQMQAARPSGQMQAARPSGQMQAARPSGQMQAARSSGQMPAHGGRATGLDAESGGAPPPSTPGSTEGAHAEEPHPHSVSHADLRKPSAAEVVAKYPPTPGAVWRAPIYACQVLYRQLELRQDLDSLRRRRSPDVPLYEAALRAHDTKTFALGLAIACAVAALMMFVFFLPVILRFVREPP